MEFRVLGPLEVVDRGRSVALARTKERTVLALLLLRANELVSCDRLIDEIWGERAPASARHTLEAYVSRLRATLVGHGSELIESRAGGYVIHVAPEQLDAKRFERLLEEGQRALDVGSFEDADEKLREALALWRGGVLSDLVFEPLPAAEVARIEELRLVASEAQVEAALALGHDGVLVAELHALVSRYPLRERLRAQLMLALYRLGRQAEAIDAYLQGKELLAEQLGVDPDPELQRLYARILSHDTTLTAPSSLREAVLQT